MNKLGFSLDDGVININNKIIDLPYPVADVLKINDLLVVRVEPSVGEVFNNNVYGFESDVGFKWQIAESPHGTEMDKPFISMSVSPDNRLIVGNWNGLDYEVNLADGSISAVSFNK